jgi:ABC-type glycerol-3-phosphate transport system permease component
LTSCRKASKWGLSVAFGALFLTPVIWLVIASFKPPAAIFLNDWHAFFAPRAWTLENYPHALGRSNLVRAMCNSIAQITVIALVGALVNSMAAFAFARFVFRGREALFALVVALIILPVEVLAVPLFLTARDLGLTAGVAPVFVALSVPFVAKAFNIYFLRQHFLSWPIEQEEAAILDGAGVWNIFWSLALPAIKPALATVVVLDVILHWSDFLWPLLITSRESNRTVQIALATLFTEPPIDWGAIMACSVLSTLPVLAGFRYFQRYVVATDARPGWL